MQEEMQFWHWCLIVTWLCKFFLIIPLIYITRLTVNTPKVWTKPFLYKKGAVVKIRLAENMIAVGNVYFPSSLVELQAHEKQET